MISYVEVFQRDYRFIGNGYGAMFTRTFRRIDTNVDIGFRAANYIFSEFQLSPHMHVQFEAGSFQIEIGPFEGVILALTSEM